MEQRSRVHYDEDSSLELGDRSMYENVGPDYGPINGEEADGPIDGDEADDADEDSVSEVPIHVQMFLGQARRLQLMCSVFFNYAARD
jgi:hypothetical protein